MSYPNITRQSATLPTRLHKLLILKANFNQLASNNLVTLSELRHQATNYDHIRKPEILNKYVDDLSDYNYSLEYLQTYVKEMANSSIANKLLELNKTKDAKYQAKVSEKDSECEALKMEMTHLDLLIKELKKEREADQLKLAQHESEIAKLKKENAEQYALIDTLDKNIVQLKTKVKNEKSATIQLKREVLTNKANIQQLTEELHQEKDSVAKLELENTEQYSLIGELDTQVITLKEEVKEEKLNVAQLVSALREECNSHMRAISNQASKHKSELDTQSVTYLERLADQAQQHKLELDTKAQQHKLELEEKNEEWRIKFERNNEEWQKRLDERLAAQKAYFEAEIAEVRGRLDNLEAQMRAMKADTEALETKVEQLSNPITEETKQTIVRDLSNVIALSYATISNLQLIDKEFEQRRIWLGFLKRILKLTKALSRFGFNIKQHLAFLNLMVKANPC